jgi:hypothetical protein
MADNKEHLVKVELWLPPETVEYFDKISAETETSGERLMEFHLQCDYLDFLVGDVLIKVETGGDYDRT